MRKIREVLRLYHAAGMSVRAIARSVKASPSTVGEYIRRAEVHGLGWPLPGSLDDGELEHRLFPTPAPSGTRRPLPDWSKVHRELRRKGVTLALLWQEYKASHPEGLQYSQFCERYTSTATRQRRPDALRRSPYMQIRYTSAALPASSNCSRTTRRLSDRPWGRCLQTARSFRSRDGSGASASIRWPAPVLAASLAANGGKVRGLRGRWTDPRRWRL